jgi:hypothetical protein
MQPDDCHLILFFSLTVPVIDAAARIAFGNVFNMGQTCVAPDYVLCPRAAVEEFVARFAAAMARMYPSMADNPQYTGIVNDKEYERLDALVADAVKKGARVIAVNPAGENCHTSRRAPGQDCWTVFNQTLNRGALGLPNEGKRSQGTASASLPGI